MAVERVREGEPAAKVIEAYGFNRTTIYKCLNSAMRPGVGISSLSSTKATGRPRSMTPAQERQVFRWINVRLGVTAVGELLAKLGLTPQKPLQRAYQHDPEAIERWQREAYPAVGKQARKQGAEVFFCDESGFRAYTVHGKTWGCEVRRRS